MTSDRGNPGTATPRSKRLPLEGHDGVTVRWIQGKHLTDDEAATIVDLLVEAYEGQPWGSSAPQPVLHLQWKVRDAPDGAEICVMEEGDKLVGMIIESRERYRLLGATRTARGGGDAATRVSHQGQGLNSAFSRHRQARPHPDTELILGFYSHPMQLRRIERGYRTALGDPVEELLRPLDISRLVAGQSQSSQTAGSSWTADAERERVRRLPRPAWLRSAAWHGRVLWPRLRQRRRARARITWSVRPIVSFDDRIERLVDEGSQQFDLIRERTAAYLNWRYCDPRGGEYTVLLAEENGKALGYVAVAMERYVGAIADLLVVPGRDDVAGSLIDEAIRVTRQAGAAGLRSWVTRSHPYKEALLTRGFLLRSSQSVLAFTSLQGDSSTFDCLGEPGMRAHVMLGDSDHV